MKIAVLALALTILVVYGEKPKAQSDAHGQNPAHAAPQADNAAGGSVIVVNQQTPQGQQDSHTAKPPNYLSRLFSPENLPNLALVIVAGVTGWFIALQAREMSRATKEMQAAGKLASDTAVQQLRAYVCISKAHIAFIQERAPEVQVHIKNSGKTPARHVRMWIGIGHGPYPITGTLPPPPPGFQTSSSVLGPGEEPQAMRRQYPAFPEESMPILGTPELTLFAYGQIVYRDAFDIERHTEYRLIFGGTERHRLTDENGIATAFLRADTQGNEAD